MCKNERKTWLYNRLYCIAHILYFKQNCIIILYKFGFLCRSNNDKSYICNNYELFKSFIDCCNLFIPSCIYCRFMKFFETFCKMNNGCRNFILFHYVFFMGAKLKGIFRKDSLKRRTCLCRIIEI